MGILPLDKTTQCWIQRSFDTENPLEEVSFFLGELSLAETHDHHSSTTSFINF